MVRPFYLPGRLLSFEDLSVGFGSAGDLDGDAKGLQVGRELEPASAEERTADLVGKFDGVSGRSAAGGNEACEGIGSGVRVVLAIEFDVVCVLTSGVGEGEAVFFEGTDLQDEGGCHRLGSSDPSSCKARACSGTFVGVLDVVRRTV